MRNLGEELQATEKVITFPRSSSEMAQTVAQKALLFVLYALLILVVVFFILSLGNRGQEAFDKCMQEKCERKGEQFCQKYRELSNCCIGTGGTLQQVESRLECVFPE